MGTTYDLGLWDEGGWDGLLGVDTPPAGSVATLSRLATGSAVLATRPPAGMSTATLNPVVQGPLAPTAAGNTLSIGGGWAWTNPTRAFASDNSYAENAPSAANLPCGLSCSTFGLAAFPPVGIVVTVEAKSTGDIPMAVALRKPDGTYSDPKTIAWVFPEDEIVFTLGTATDLWGLTISATELAHADFAVVVYGTEISLGADHYYVDAVTVTTYHAAGRYPDAGISNLATRPPIGGVRVNR